MMIETILIAVGNDAERMKPVVEHAAEIAGALEAHVVLFHVYTEEDFEERLEEFGFESSDPTELAKRHSATRSSASTLKEGDVSFSIVATIGDPASEIANFVEENAIDHIFMGGRRRTATKKAVLGSVSQSVLVSVDVPCTVLMQ